MNSASSLVVSRMTWWSSRHSAANRPFSSRYAKLVVMRGNARARLSGGEISTSAGIWDP
jgi:hypothetical protein